MKTRVGAFITHPIQYQTPLWRELACCSELDFEVNYLTEHGLDGSIDRDFGLAVRWDIPLLEGYSNRFLKSGGSVYKTRSVSLPDAQAFLRQQKYDAILIHGYTYRFERQVLSAAYSLGIPVILRGEFTDQRPRSQIKSVFRDQYLKWFYSRVSKFAAIGSQARKHLDRFRVSDDRIFWSPYCVDSNRFEEQYQTLDRIECRNKLGIRPDACVLLVCGKLIPRKQPEIVLDAISKISNQSKYQVVFVGDGPMREEMEAQVRAMPEGLVQMHGFVNQEATSLYYRSADVLILPSQFETWGLVVNEAMQFSVPVIVSDAVGCHHDLVRPENGYIFRVGDALDLRSGIEHVTATPENITTMGTASRELIEDFSLEKAARGICQAAIENLIRQVA